MLTQYSWDDIQDYITALPMDKVVKLYGGKKGNDKERFLEALCNRDEHVMDKMTVAAEAFEKKLRKKKDSSNKGE